MRGLGAEQRPLRRLVPWLLVLIVLGLAVGLTVWARQQDTARRTAEARADAAETRAAVAEASLTAVTRSSSAATATALAEANLPEAALKRALELVFQAYKDPTDGRLRAMSAAFGQDALSFERLEAEHLISAGTHLAGISNFDVQVLSTNAASQDQSQVRTREVWTYDEVDEQGRRSRCVREESEQTYTLQRVSGGWLVDQVQLSAPARRTDC